MYRCAECVSASPCTVLSLLIARTRVAQDCNIIGFQNSLSSTCHVPFLAAPDTDHLFLSLVVRFFAKRDNLFFPFSICIRHYPNNSESSMLFSLHPLTLGTPTPVPLLSTETKPWDPCSCGLHFMLSWGVVVFFFHRGCLISALVNVVSFLLRQGFFFPLPTGVVLVP